MRELLQRYGIYLSLALIATAFAAYFLGRGRGPAEGNTAYAFFVDENNLSHEVVRPVSDYPPVLDSDGKTMLVQAIKRSDDGGKTSYIAYLLKYSPELQQTLQRATRTSSSSATESSEPPRETAMIMDRGTFVRSPKPGSPWVPATAPEAAALMYAGPNENGQVPLTIYPSR